MTYHIPLSAPIHLLQDQCFSLIPPILPRNKWSSVMDVDHPKGSVAKIPWQTPPLRLTPVGTKLNFALLLPRGRYCYLAPFCSVHFGSFLLLEAPIISFWHKIYTEHPSIAWQGGNARIRMRAFLLFTELTLQSL